ncbi:M14 family metallopeptidase [Thioalkalicoccus limnaeus]|uniref:M14 family metallopeptidase n=1 Tax=Thioalkalicoccus limnaeus TaxID=120681 RepID=A0ABV4BGR9_9GAMM
MSDTPVELTILEALPEGLLDCPPTDLHRVLPGPTLIHLPGEREPPLFVSVLMHGNEPVGWDAVRLSLRDGLERHGRFGLPRALSLFIGNVAAAAHGQRRLPGQPDYNRVWPGSELPATPEHALMASVVEAMRARGLFASIDLHNNTGANPHYACVNVIDNRFLHLATLFSRTVVYFLRPRGVQSQAMAALGPAVTLECGKAGEAYGVAQAREFINACLHLSELPEYPVPAQDIDLFHTVAQMRVPADIRFGFPPAQPTLILSPELERLNFRELPAGTAFARVRAEAGAAVPALLDVRDERGRDVANRFFVLEDGELRLKVSAMPSMLTADLTVIRQDCLGYLMERYDQCLPRRGD